MNLSSSSYTAKTMAIKIHSFLFIFMFCYPLNNASIIYTISENAYINMVIGHVVSQSDLTSRYNSSVLRTLQYSLMSRGSLPTDYFTIDNKTSELRVAKQIDRDNLCDLLMICCEFEGQCSIRLSVVVQPNTGKFFLETVKVNVRILDENDNRPQFQAAILYGQISEIADVGTSVLLDGNGNPLLATDPDEGNNGVKRYSIISPTDTFEIKVEEEYRGIITSVSLLSKKPLDREKIATYDVVVIAHDGGSPPESGSVTVSISVIDFNDNAPVFMNKTYTVWLDETAPLNTKVVQVEAKDADAGLNADINYSIANRPNDIVSRLFTINSITGEIRTKGKLNFEQRTAYTVLVVASDEGVFVKQRSRTTVTVNLRDVNDHGPVIETGYLTASDRAEVSESAPIGTFVIFFIVTDPDDDAVGCYVDNPMFRLTRSSTDKNEYHLLTAHQLNRELSDRYKVELSCTDQGHPQLITTETFTVYILDANDNAPAFSQAMYTASVTENNAVDVFLLEVKAHDLDAGENARIIYSLNEEGQELFSINSASGRIFAKQVFDREKDAQLRFKVVAKDNGTQPLFAEVPVFISIEDENDNAPTFHNTNKFEISEAAGAGVMLRQMSASDPDTGLNAEITFSLKADTDALAFAITKNGIITTRVQLDRERQSEYHLVVIARDRGMKVVHSSSSTVTIYVTDINDNPPILHFPNSYNNTIYISYLESVGHVVGQINATDDDSGRNSMLKYSFTHGNEKFLFLMDQNTGLIKLAKRLQKEDAIVYKMSVRVMDCAEPYNANVDVLNIVVDGSGKAISSDGRYLDNVTNNRNLIIVICLAGVSVILAIILVVAIICIRRADQERRRYNVQKERQTASGQHLSPLPNKEPRYQPPIRRDINYSTEVDDTYNHVNGDPSPIYSSLRTQNWKSSIYPKAMDIGTKV